MLGLLRICVWLCAPNPAQASKDCVQKTISRMEQKLTGRTLNHVVFMLRSSDRAVQQRAPMSLARLAPEQQIKSIFVDKRGLEVLLDMLCDPVSIMDWAMTAARCNKRK